MSDQHDWGEGALALYEAILQVDPEDEAAAVGRARCLRALGRLESRWRSFETLMKERPDNPVARSQASKTKRHLDARSRAERLLAKDPQEVFDALERAKRQERDHKFQVEGRRLLARRDRTIEAACALGAAQPEFSTRSTIYAPIGNSQPRAVARVASSARASFLAGFGSARMSM
jgi:thioredoxin-like negative regulator of GroEL